jgi:hypothetical protein
VAAHHRKIKKDRTAASEFRPANDFDAGSQEFRFRVLQPAGTTDVTDLLESVEWRDEGNALNLNTLPVLRGSATWHRHDPDIHDKAVVQLGDGDRLRCDVKWLGKWEPLWQMRVVKPPETDVAEGSVNAAELADDLYIATESEGRFRYRAGKKKKRSGWLYHEIVRDVCRRYRIPVGPLVQGTKRIKHFDPEGQPISPLEAIRQVVELEQKYTGRRYIICWRPDRKGRFCLQVVHPVRNPYLYTLREELRSATASPVARAERATAVVATGTTKKGKHGKRRKIVRRVVNRRAIRRYGYIEKRFRVPGSVTGASEVVREAKAHLAKELKLVRNLTNVTHTGIAFVRRGDVVRVSIPEEGFKGAAGVLFITSVTHSLSGSDYTMSLDLTWRDPLDPAKVKAEREKALRARKRAARGKTKKKGS